MLKRLMAVAVVAMAAPLPAHAGAGTDILRDGLYAGELAATGEKLKPLADAGEQDAKFGLGLVGFVAAIEGLSQALYRHGVAAPDGGPLAAGVLGAPIPVKSPYGDDDWARAAPKIAGLPGGYRQEDVVRLLMTGKTKAGHPPSRPMPPFRMNREDASAVAAYLASLEPPPAAAPVP